MLDRLILLTPLLLAETLTRKGGFGTTALAGLHEVTVLFNFLDDVFGLHFPLEAPESVFERFALLNNNFSHAYSPPSGSSIRMFLVKDNSNRFSPKPAMRDGSNLARTGSQVINEETEEIVVSDYQFSTNNH
jgi:hypothetical protein